MLRSSHTPYAKSYCENNDDDAYAALDRLKERRWKPTTAKSLERIRDALFTSSDFDGAAGLCETLCIASRRLQ